MSMNYYNPYMQQQQQRLANYEQNFLQPQMQAQTTQPAFKMIPVTNEYEANATPVDVLNGIPTFFYNQSANEVYMKQSLPNGAATFIKFAKRNEAELKENVVPGANIYEKDFKALNEKIDGLYKLFNLEKEPGDEIKTKGGKNVK